MLISLLHPTRLRPEKSLATIERWVSQAGCEIDVVVSLDTDDPLFPLYQKLYTTTDHRIIINNNRSAVDAVNNAAKEAKGDVFIVVSDDFDCPNNWGPQLLKIIHGKTDYVIKVNDGIQRWIITLPILDRVYYERYNYVYHPDFKHMFVDTYFTHQAEAQGRIIKAEHLDFIHNHYSVRRGKKDAVSYKADSTWNQGKSVYLRLVRENYGKMGNYGLYTRHAQGHIQWLRKALRH